MDFLNFLDDLNTMGGPIFILYIIIVVAARFGVDFHLLRIMLDLIEHIIRIMLMINLIIFTETLTVHTVADPPGNHTIS